MLRPGRNPAHRDAINAVDRRDRIPVPVCGVDVLGSGRDADCPGKRAGRNLRDSGQAVAGYRGADQEGGRALTIMT